MVELTRPMPGSLKMGAATLKPGFNAMVGKAWHTARLAAARTGRAGNGRSGGEGRALRQHLVYMTKKITLPTTLATGMWVHCLVPDFLPGEQETVVPGVVYVFGVVLRVESSLGPGPTTPGEQAGLLSCLP